MEEKLHYKFPDEYIKWSPSFRKELYSSLWLDESISAWIISIIAPLLQKMSLSSARITAWTIWVEKLWLFARSAFEQYGKQTPEKKAYLRRIWESGKPSLMRDLAFHDPYFGALMIAWQKLFPDINTAWLLAVTLWSFGVALWLAIETEVRGWQYLYSRFQKKLSEQWALQEKYFETKWYVTKPWLWDQIIQDMNKRFDLGTYQSWKLNDTYYNKKRNLLSLNWKKGKVRERERISLDYENHSEVSTQIIYSRSFRVEINKLFNNKDIISPIDKHKYTLPFENGQPHQLVKKIAKDSIYNTFSVDRMFTNKQDEIYAWRDKNHSKDYSWTFIEFKGHPAQLDKVIDATHWTKQTYWNDIQFFTVWREKIIKDKRN